jgi:hypothetical protein
MSNFQEFCEETGRDAKLYSNVHLFEEFAEWYAEKTRPPVRKWWEAIHHYLDNPSTPSGIPHDPPLLPGCTQEIWDALEYMDYSTVLRAEELVLAIFAQLATAPVPAQGTPPAQPKYPMPCGLCESQIESAEDTEWHGIGDCVPICSRCLGSGIDPKDDLKITESEAQELAELDKRGVKFVQSAPIPARDRSGE